MTETFDPRSITTGEYDAQIDYLKGRQAELREALQQTEAELKWWQDGQALFAGAPRVSPRQEVIRELALHEPAGSSGISTAPAEKPVLREAIFEVLRQDPSRPWKAQEILQRLDERGWMPNGANASHIVRSRLSALTKAGQLRRAGYGEYGFPEGGETP